jgi:hypothetical protein
LSQYAGSLVGNTHAMDLRALHAQRGKPHDKSARNLAPEVFKLSSVEQLSNKDL